MMGILGNDEPAAEDVQMRTTTMFPDTAGVVPSSSPVTESAMTP